MAEMKYYRSTFDDTIGMVTKDGMKFNFENRLIRTDDPRVQEVLDERVAHKKFQDVKVISQEEAEEYMASFKRPVRTWDDGDDNPNGETLLTPQAALAAAMRARNQALSQQAIESSKESGSVQLETNLTAQPTVSVGASAALEAVRIKAAAARAQEQANDSNQPEPFNPQVGIVNSSQLETKPESGK